MFIDLNEIKGMIVDIDSFPSETDSSWVKVNKNIKVLFFSSNDRERLDKLKLLDNNFFIYLGSPISFFLKRAIVEMLKLMEIHSYETVFVSGLFQSLLRIQELPIATIQYSPNIKDEEVGNLSDFQITSIDHLDTIINNETIGYFSEAASIIYNKGSRLSFKYGKVIVFKKEHQGFECNVVSGGRYFNTNDVRYPFHQLSQRILKNKRENSQERVFLQIYNNLIRYIDENIEQIDGVTRVPPRPSDVRDRFSYIVKGICEKDTKIANYNSYLKCIKDYPSQKGLNALEREENIKGAFAASNVLEGKHIVLIDDVISTGSTSFEAAKTMFEKGAKKVTILVLAINQLTNNIRRHNYIPLYCKCGEELKMRFSGYNNSAFFGCNGFAKKTCTETLPYFEGILKHNSENEIVEKSTSIDEWDF